MSGMPLGVLKLHWFGKDGPLPFEALKTRWSRKDGPVEGIEDPMSAKEMTTRNLSS